MVNIEMTVIVRGEALLVNVVGSFHQAKNRSYMRVTLPNGVKLEHKCPEGFINPWASTQYVRDVIEASKWWSKGELTPDPRLDSGEDQLGLL